MSKRYVVLDRSFINGRLYEPGETVVLEIDSPGSNLKLVSNKTVDAPATGDDDTRQEDAYVAVRGAAGKFVIKDAEGGRVGTFSGTKTEAEAEAARLNAGGLPIVDDDTHQEDGTGNDSGLPDA